MSLHSLAALVSVVLIDQSDLLSYMSSLLRISGHMICYNMATYRIL